MKLTRLIFGLLLLTVLVTTLNAGAYEQGVITRTQDTADFNPAVQNTPLFEITEYQPYSGGTNNQDFITVTNNYDEQISTTVSLSNNNWEFSSTGTTTRTITLQPNESVLLQVDIGGANKQCSKSQTTWSYTYSVTGQTLTIQDTTQNVTICGGTGGNGNGNGGGNGNGPGGNGPPGQN